jgi:hypothetical protein
MMLFRSLLLAALVAGAYAQVPNTLTPQEKAGGWVLLFDGKTMNGWDDPSRKSPPGDAWAIEDGALKATRRPKVRQDLFTDAKFRDFELTFDWRISPRGNSGVKYRIQDRFFVEEHSDNPALKKFEHRTNYRMVHRLKEPPADGQEYVVGFEYQVIDNGGKQPAGSLYDMIPASREASRPAGEWNQSRIVVKGNRFEHWLNGVKVLDNALDSVGAKEGIERRWGAGSPVAKALLDPKPEGPICLQNHNDEAWFRNIKLRRL